MKNALFLTFLLTLINSISFSQDKVLLKNGTVIEAKVLEVGTDDVKYQLKTKDGTGAIYTVPKTKIEVIVFESGYREEFKDITAEMADLTKKHLIGFNYFDLILQNFSFDYEYFFAAKNDFSLYVPLRIGFPRDALHFNPVNVIETGIGVFIYPYRKKKLNYFTGIETMYSNKLAENFLYDPSTGGVIFNSPEHRNYLGVYITNGIKLNFRERFGLGYSFSVGLNTDLYYGGANIMAKGNMSFFFRL